MNKENDTITSSDDTLSKTCGFCGKLFTAQRSSAKYCTEACKQQVKRIKSLDRQGNPPTTPTDKLFDEANPAYYKFSDTIRTNKCLICNKEFTTTLNLLRTCSPDCQNKLLKGLSGGGRD